ncbi:hypothetical protein DL96DRAFT_1607871 [Flagelloscypha sp. PMI_526]|nr:hypothetical protein DL96DRAFT_1607871 [Flagelloscypha sp. PMI_526]
MFFERRKWLGDDLTVIPCFWNITELQITAQFEWDRDDSFLQRLSLQPLPSLEYLSLRPPTPIWTSAELIAHIRTILIPQFPQSLKVCILYDGLWRDSSENRGSLSNEMKQLIMGYVDERIILATDKQVKLSPSAPYSDFLVKLPSYDPFVGHLCSKTAHTWTEIVSLMKRRKELRGVWKQQFPRIGTKVKVKNHAARLTTADWMLLVACAVPVLVWMGGEAVWRKIRN